MIRINLIPGPRGKAAKGQWDIRFELAGAVGLVVLALGACLVWSSILNNEIQAKEMEKQVKTKQITVLRAKLKQVADFEGKKKQLEEKTRVIEQLEKSRGAPVRVLDYLSYGLEPLKLWVVNLSLKGQRVELSGQAMTNDDIVVFVNRLDETGYFSNIRLVESRSAGTKMGNSYRFKLNLTLKG
ncbi:MAG: PilN domain-containing protein [Nitrospiraceae bacterium]